MSGEKWAVNANDAISISLMHGDRDKRNVSFKPQFTYPIYGEEEIIYGYRGLEIKINLKADTLQPDLKITWEKKMPSTGEVKPDNVKAPLTGFFPPLESPPSAPTASFNPPGNLIHEYKIKGRNFGIWSASLADPAVKEIMKSMQMFVIFFIEGGSCIDVDDPNWTVERWRVFFVYAIDPPPHGTTSSAYSLVGFSTAYRLWFLDTETNPLISKTETKSWQIPEEPDLISQLPSRERISQFVILPPYQNSGHGSELYETMMKKFLDDATIKEITVEDPNESFDDLRDLNDLRRLRLTPEFATLSINPDVKASPRNAGLPFAKLLPQDMIAQLRKSSKIHTRQFARLIEMQLLSRIPSLNRSLTRITRKDRASDPQDRAYYWWRLIVKERLMRHNLDTLIQLDREERIDKLDETLAVVERDYVSRLEQADKRAAKEAERIGQMDVDDDNKNGVANGSARANGRTKKRKIVGDDDDEDEVEASSGKQSKLARVQEDDDED